MCGGADEATAAKIKDLPIWAFHGAKDTAVKPERSRTGAGGPGIRRSYVNDSNHDDLNIWSYGDPEREEDRSGHGAGPVDAAVRPAGLLPDPQAADHLKVALAVMEPQVFQQARPLRHHHQQPAAAGMVLGMRLEMVGQVGDPGGQECDLHFR